MTLFPALRNELLDVLARVDEEAAREPVPVPARRRGRWRALPVIAAALLGGAGIATAAVVVLPTADLDRPPTPAVDPAFGQAFSLFRSDSGAPVPADVARQLGLNGGPRGKNLALARSFETDAGTAWVIPGEDSLCVAASPGSGIGYGMSCATRGVALSKGVELGFGRTDGSKFRALVVPDGFRVWRVDGETREPVSLVSGTAAVRTAPGERVEIDRN